MLYRDAEGQIFEFSYIITQTEDEGPERLEFRLRDESLDEDEQPNWTEWPENFPLIPAVNSYFHGSRVVFDIPLPTIEEVFHTIRATADDLANIEATGAIAAALETASKNLKGIGDYDEPLSELIKAEIAGDQTPENHTILGYIAGCD